MAGVQYGRPKWAEYGRTGARIEIEKARESLFVVILAGQLTWSAALVVLDRKWSLLEHWICSAGD